MSEQIPEQDDPPVEDPETPQPYPELLEGRTAKTDQDPEATYDPDFDGPALLSLAGSSPSRTGANAVAWARNQHYNPYRDWTRDCQMFVRSCFGVGPKFGSAYLAYIHTDYRHTSHTQVGVPVWFRGPGPAWHVALAVGDGTCYTNDYVRRGKIDRVGILTLSRGWGCPYLGWSEDINDVRIWRPAGTVIDISQVIYAARHYSTVPGGNKLKRALASEMGTTGGMNMDSAALGPNFRALYKRLQIRWYGTGDGIPGPTSLTRLCKAHGLSVRP